MSPATKARHLSIVRPSMTYRPILSRGLRGASFLRSFPVTFLFINYTVRSKEQVATCGVAKRRDANEGRATNLLSMAQQKELISTINNLIETLKDGQKGFKQAAEAVKDSDLKSLFSEYSLQRSRFAGELQAQALQLGESKPEDSSS